MLNDVVLDVVVGPGDDGVDFQPPGLVDFEDGSVRAGRRVDTLESRHPRGVAGQRFLERHDFPHVAAEGGIGRVEILAVALVLLAAGEMRNNPKQPVRIPPLHGIRDIQRFGKVVAGV